MFVVFFVVVCFVFGVGGVGLVGGDFVVDFVGGGYYWYFGCCVDVGV